MNAASESPTARRNRIACIPSRSVGAGVVDWQSIRENEGIGLSIVDEEVVEVAAPPNQPLVLHIENIVCLCNDLVFIIM